MTCVHAGTLSLTLVPGHPEKNRSWFVESCSCGAKRVAEHEDSGDLITVRSATLWRGGMKRLDIAKRRQQVVALRSEGRTMRQIAEALNVSLGTVANDLVEAT